MRWSPADTAAIVLVLACTASAPDLPALRAFGNEPFWNVTLSEADGILYSRLGEEPIAFPYQPPSHPGGDATTRSFGPLRDDSGEHQIEIRIAEEDCQDTMADAVHPLRATVTVDGEELTGCARHLDDPAPKSP